MLEKHSVTFGPDSLRGQPPHRHHPGLEHREFSRRCVGDLRQLFTSLTIASASTATTSADTGPSTSEQISFSTSRGSSRPPVWKAEKDWW